MAVRPPPTLPRKPPPTDSRPRKVRGPSRWGGGARSRQDRGPGLVGPANPQGVSLAGDTRHSLPRPDPHPGPGTRAGRGDRVRGANRENREPIPGRRNGRRGEQNPRAGGGGPGGGCERSERWGGGLGSSPCCGENPKRQGSPEPEERGPRGSQGAGRGPLGLGIREAAGARRAEPTSEGDREPSGRGAGGFSGQGERGAAAHGPSPRGRGE